MRSEVQVRERPEGKTTCLPRHFQHRWNAWHYFPNLINWGNFPMHRQRADLSAGRALSYRFKLHCCILICWLQSGCSSKQLDLVWKCRSCCLPLLILRFQSLLTRFNQYQPEPGVTVHCNGISTQGKASPLPRKLMSSTRASCLESCSGGCWPPPLTPKAICTD